MRKGEKLSYFNHINQSLMKTPKCDVTAKHMCYLIENFVLSLLTEICTSFGIMKSSLIATASSQHLGAWCIQKQGPLFSEHLTILKHSAENFCMASDLPEMKLVHWIFLRGVYFALSFLTVYKEKWVFEIWEQHTWKHNHREKLNMLHWIFTCHVIYMTFLEF